MTGKRLLYKSAQKLVVCRCLSSAKRRPLWTPEKIVNSPHRSIDISSRTILEHTWENLEKWSNKTALVCGITNRSYSYHEVYKYSRNFAANLRNKLNIRDGDVVCVMMPNSPEYAIVMLGVLEAGGIVTTVNPAYTAYEVHHQIIDSNTKLVIGVSDTVSVVKDALLLAKLDLPIISLKGSSEIIPPRTISFEELAFADNVDQSVLKTVHRLSEDIALLPYSSGTTGLPKGVELTHKNIVVNLMQTDVETFRHYDETTSKDQPGHSPWFVTILSSIWTCCGIASQIIYWYKIVTLPAFKTSTLINILKQNPINLMYAVPPLVLFLGSHNEVTKEQLAPVRTVISAAAPLPIIDIENVMEKLRTDANFISMYGMTETSPVVSSMLLGSTDHSTVGYGASNTELMIVNSEMQPLGPNEVGELLIRGPQVMKGYRNNPSATKHTITEDGWLKSGDIASIDENGVITVKDRIKELIKVKGYQVAPAELENILKDHPDVADAAVIGIPDTKQGEFPKAFIVLKDGHKTNSDKIKAFVAQRVAEYKKVKEITFLESLPKSASGKILRRVLKEKYT